MTRYKDSIDLSLRRFRRIPKYLCLLLVPPGDMQEIAAYLAQEISAEFPIFNQIIADIPPERMVVVGLEGVNNQQLSELNGRRDWLKRMQRVVFFVVHRWDYQRLLEYAPDFFSGLDLEAEIEFIPAPGSLTADRQALHLWYQQQVGTLDLRGFVRSERDDISWPIEAIYQDLQAESSHTAELSHIWPRKQKLKEGLSFYFENIKSKPARPIVLYGAPGAGKTFFLRNLILQINTAERFWGCEHPVGLLISLSAWGNTPGLVPLKKFFPDWMLKHGLQVGHQLDVLAQQGRVIFLLDGLDEITEGRRRSSDAIIPALQQQYPACPILVTTRAGFYPDFLHFALNISPFEATEIQQFLRQWCARYALDRGMTVEEGQQQGEDLFQQIQTRSDLKGLAQTPLLLTLLVLAHRSGGRFPGHRIELYSYLTTILVERWNQVRSLDLARRPTPLRVADAVRLLGPVALGYIKSGSRGGILEDRLRHHFERVLQNKPLREHRSSDSLVRLFSKDLGLIQEQSPGLYSFFHLSFAEYFAALELVRDTELEFLIMGEEVWNSELREVFRLAVAEVGLVRAQDRRLFGLIDTLVMQSQHAPISPNIPLLLGGLLADEPGLSVVSVRQLIGALVPDWWFGKDYPGEDSVKVLRQATELLETLKQGEYWDVISSMLEQYFGTGIPDVVLKRVLNQEFRNKVGIFLKVAVKDWGPGLMDLARVGEVVLDDQRMLRVVPVGYYGSEFDVYIRLTNFLEEKIKSNELSVDVFVFWQYGNEFQHQLTLSNRVSENEWGVRIYNEFAYVNYDPYNNDIYMPAYIALHFKIPQKIKSESS